MGADCCGSGREASAGGGASRRGFLKTAGLSAAAVSALGPRVFAAEENGSASETLVQQLYGSLTAAQRTAVCMPFDHALRQKVDNNWNIVKPTIAELFSKEQQALIKEIFLKLHSEEYAQKVYEQVVHDSEDIGGFGACSVALFGEPGKADNSKFEFVLTGRHVTRRCDGNSVEGAAFGGPIFYGHAARSFNEKPDHAENIYWYQGLQANEVFKSLSGKQRELALRKDPRPERGTETVKLAGRSGKLNGLPLGELSADQKELVKKTLSGVLAPFRKADSDEALKLIDASGGIDRLSMAYFANMDIGNDGVWDVWQIEGPDMVWYFRGAPHIHVWVNVKAGS
jgi:hypothetical protein